MKRALGLVPGALSFAAMRGIQRAQSTRNLAEMAGVARAAAATWAERGLVQSDAPTRRRVTPTTSYPARFPSTARAARTSRATSDASLRIRAASAEPTTRQRTRRISYGARHAPVDHRRTPADPIPG